MTHHVALQRELIDYRAQNVEADVCGFSLPGFWLRKSESTLAQGTTGSAPFRTPCSSLPRGRGDQLPSGAQLFFAVCFDWHLAGKLASPLKVEEMMFVKSNQLCLAEVQKYNAVIAAQQE